MTRAPYRPGRPLDGLTRRSFLAASVGVGALAALTSCSQSDVEQAGADRPLPAGTPILVLLTMYGGNDTLNTLIPYADPAYRAARPELAWGESEVLRLDDRFGLNPGLPGLAKAWADGKLSIVRGVGYPKPDHSHFRSMDIWQTASPDRPIRSGWLGRWLDASGADPLLALHVGTVVPPLGVGESRIAGALTPAIPKRAGGADPLHGLAVPDGADSAAAQAVVASYAAAERVTEQLVAAARQGDAAATGSATTGTGSPTGSGSPTEMEEEGAAGEATRGGQLSRQLAVVAQCIKAGAPTRAYSVSLGGFDTHAAEKEAHRSLLGQVDAALTTLRSSLAGHARGRDVVVMAYSEFGRRVAGNASAGTDHGTAGTIYLLGDRVSPGFHGDHPSLTDLVDGDLKSTTDFRAVYAEVARKVLGADPGRVVPGAPGELGVLA